VTRPEEIGEFSVSRVNVRYVKPSFPTTLTVAETPDNRVAVKLMTGEIIDLNSDSKSSGAKLLLVKKLAINPPC
jgi:hypothetical protein